MDRFSLGSAWSKGLGFFSAQAAAHAVILIGMGVVVPTILNFLLAGGLTAPANPAAIGQNAFATIGYTGAAVLIVSLLAFVLQTGSYFASWRLGLGGDGDGMGAVLYGLVTAAIIVAMLAGLVFVMALLIGAQLGFGGGGAVAVILFVLALVPLALLFAALFTVVTAAVCGSMIIVLLLVAAFGSLAAMANPALMSRGGGAMVLIMLALTLLLFWLVARLSCTTATMARHGSLNLFSAMAESWRMTAEAQWRILGYLALIGTMLCVGFFIFALFVGASMMGAMQAGGPPAMGTGAIIVSLLASVPLAYLAVLVPAGIFLELEGDSPAEIFA
jgi:hypothetical protein